MNKRRKSGLLDPKKCKRKRFIYGPCKKEDKAKADNAKQEAEEAANEILTVINKKVDELTMTTKLI